jgi:hypothetical protein
MTRQQLLSRREQIRNRVHQFCRTHPGVRSRGAITAALHLSLHQVETAIHDLYLEGQLSPRPRPKRDAQEAAIIAGVAQGHDYDQIAAACGVSRGRVLELSHFLVQQGRLRHLPLPPVVKEAATQQSSRAASPYRGPAVL